MALINLDKHQKEHALLQLLQPEQTGANLSAELAAQTAGVTASRTLALTDNGVVLNCNSGSAIVLTISPESSVAWAGVARQRLATAKIRGASL